MVKLENNFHVYYQYVVAHTSRDKIIKKMLKKNIDLNITYPYPIHMMKAYKNFTYDNRNYFFETEKKAKVIFSLPIYHIIKNYEI